MCNELFLRTFVDLDATLLSKNALKLAEDLAQTVFDGLVTISRALKHLLDVAIAAFLNDSVALFSVFKSFLSILYRL